MDPIHITSEIGKLKVVVLHRPGEELENLTPDYLTDLLFDDIPYLKKAQEEHDAFAQVLRERGVEVLYLDQLATEALATDALREQFVDDMLANSKQGTRRVTETLRQFLLDLPTHAMVRKLMAGVRKDEITLPPEHHQQLHDMVEKDYYPFYLDPMPNLYFTRDPAAAIGQGLTINKMHWPARRRESLFMRYIIDHHPRFAGKNVPVWYDRHENYSIEGGDELVLNREVMAIGISERTSAEAIEKMAANFGVFVKHGVMFETPCYIPSLDIIKMPTKGQFKTAENYYATLLHEMTHATGHKSRLNRDFTGRFGTEAYAFEELIAELGAAFMCAEFGLIGATIENHAFYLDNWLSILKNDKKAIFTAASQASKAADLLKSHR